jgi:signal transduction histidine kinase
LVAIANADSRAELTTSRARIVAAGDHARRRIERDLHDGAQQRLVSLAMRLRVAQAAVPAGLVELRAQLDHVVDEATAALPECTRPLGASTRRSWPRVGCRAALPAFARRSPVPVDLRVEVPGRLPTQVELAGYSWLPRR